MRVVTTYWVNPLTGSHILPTLPGDIFAAAVAYWEDELNEWRPKRPRAAAVKQEKEARVSKAVERLNRYRNARDWFALDFRKLDKLSLKLATDDLSEVMKSAPADASSQVSA